ncbi:MAG: hypothetical protein RLZZ142_946 [Verrucomicrobiota bacterium]
MAIRQVVMTIWKRRGQQYKIDKICPKVETGANRSIQRAQVTGRPAANVRRIEAVFNKDVVERSMAVNQSILRSWLGCVVERVDRLTKEERRDMGMERHGL